MRDSFENPAAISPERVKAALKRLRPLLNRGLLRTKSSILTLPTLVNNRPERASAALTTLAVLLLGLWSQTSIINPSEIAPVPPVQEIVAPLQSTDSPERSATMPSSRGPRNESERQPLTFEDGFILSAVPPAQSSQKETKVPASVTIAQAILESDWGRSGLSKKANNFFGIKARPDPGPAGVIFMNTWEVISGANVTVNEPFRAYHSMEESFIDHGLFLLNRPWYSAAFRFADDAKQFAREIHKAGYATDPGYSNKLIALMDKYNLYAYDVK